MDTISEIQSRTGENFSREEIDKFINMGKIMAGKAVLTALIHVIESGPAAGGSKKRARVLTAKVTNTITHNYCGYLACEFEDVKCRLHISLTVAPRDYKLEIKVPSSEYARDTLQKFTMLKAIATAYWRQWVEENADLLTQIREYRPDVDFSELRVDDKNPNTMYFDAECKFRVGILAYYVDENGRPYAATCN